MINRFKKKAGIKVKRIEVLIKTVIENMERKGKT